MLSGRTIPVAPRTESHGFGKTAVPYRPRAVVSIAPPSNDDAAPPAGWTSNRVARTLPTVPRREARRTSSNRRVASRSVDRVRRAGTLPPPTVRRVESFLPNGSMASTNRPLRSSLRGDPDGQLNDSAIPTPVFVRANRAARPTVGARDKRSRTSVVATARGTTPHARAKQAARRGDWGEVASIGREQPGNVRVQSVARRAHNWAEDGLRGAYTLMRRGRLEDARSKLAEVRKAMRGQPQAIEATRGLHAIEMIQELSFLNSGSPVYRAVLRTSREEFADTRWANLFMAGA